MFMDIVGVCIGFSAGVLIARLLPSTGAVKRFTNRRRGNSRGKVIERSRDERVAERGIENFLSYTGDKQAEIEADL